MTVTAWRMYKPRYAASAFTGEGARAYGGRWNSPGTRMIYTAGTASLAALELLVHLQSRQVLESYWLCPVTIDARNVQTLRVSDLPPNWRANSGRDALRRLGDAWIESGSSAVLRVPSVIIATEFNYLVNPAHRQFSKIKIGRHRKFRFDPRLMK